MSDETLDSEFFADPRQDDDEETRFRQRNPLLGCVAGLGFVVIAAIVAFVVETLAPTSNLALVFVLPVLLTAISWGWVAALVSATAAVLTFDFFFVPPLYTLRVTSPSDIWALVLLGVVAATASAVADQSRRRAIDAQRAAGRAEALHGVASLVVRAAPPSAVIDAAASALSRIFGAPAVILLEKDTGLRQAVLVGDAALSDPDREAAKWSLSNHLPTRADSFPFERARFDFWPIGQTDGRGIVLGIGLTTGGDNRPANPERYVELVGAYLAASLSSDHAPRRRARLKPVT
jgi:K+-sensing histidine kinase KdpD